MPDCVIASVTSEARRAVSLFFFFQAEDGIRDVAVTGVQTCALPIYVVSVLVPPLRERKEDIPGLIEHFRRKYGSKYRGGAMQFSEDVVRRFQDYDYPGNVRELENLVRRLVVLRDERFVLDELTAAISRRPAMQVPLTSGPAGGALPPANQGVVHAMPVGASSAPHSSPPPA